MRGARNVWFARVLGACVCVLGIALPAQSARAPVNVDGTNWIGSGTAKLRIARVGGGTAPSTIAVGFLANMGFVAVDQDFRGYSGNYTARGKLQNKLDANFDQGSLATAKMFTEDFAENVLANKGIASDVVAALISSKAIAKVKPDMSKITFKWKLKYNGTAVDIGKSRRVTYKVKINMFPDP